MISQEELALVSASRLETKGKPSRSEQLSAHEVAMLKQGWHKERNGTIVWAEGWEYTETGNAPGRVEVIRFAGQHGPIKCWSWNAELSEVGAVAARPFVEAMRRHNAARIAMLQNDIDRLQSNTRKWEARAPETANEGPSKGLSGHEKL